MSCWARRSAAGDAERVPAISHSTTTPAPASIRLSAPKPTRAGDAATIPAPTATAASTTCQASPIQASSRARATSGRTGASTRVLTRLTLAGHAPRAHVVGCPVARGEAVLHHAVAGRGDHRRRAGRDAHMRGARAVGVEEHEVARLDLGPRDARALAVLGEAAGPERDARGLEGERGQPGAVEAARALAGRLVRLADLGARRLDGGGDALRLRGRALGGHGARRCAG